MWFLCRFANKIFYIVGNIERFGGFSYVVMFSGNYMDIGDVNVAKRSSSRDFYVIRKTD